MLKCSLCKNAKPDDQFGYSKSYPNRGNKHVWCKPCKKEYHKKYSAKWEKENREKRNARRRTPEWHEYMRNYRKDNNLTEKYRKYHQERYKSQRKEIRKKMDAWRAKNIHTWNGYSRKRRAAMNNVIHEPYNAMDIFERDKSICGLCGNGIDISLKFPNPKSFSIDHIIPISVGGNDTQNNVQSSHLGCNARKAAHGYKKD